MDLRVLTFAEARQPEFKEKKGEGYIQYGDRNDYPNYLVDLFNKSAKHNAIVKVGIIWKLFGQLQNNWLKFGIWIIQKFVQIKTIRNFGTKKIGVTETKNKWFTQRLILQTLLANKYFM